MCDALYPPGDDWDDSVGQEWDVYADGDQQEEREVAERVALAREQLLVRWAALFEEEERTRGEHCHAEQDEAASLSAAAAEHRRLAQLERFSSERERVQAAAEAQRGGTATSEGKARTQLQLTEVAQRQQLAAAALRRQRESERQQEKEREREKRRAAQEKEERQREEAAERRRVKQEERERKAWAESMVVARRRMERQAEQEREGTVELEEQRERRRIVRRMAKEHPGKRVSEALVAAAVGAALSAVLAAAVSALPEFAAPLALVLAATLDLPTVCMPPIPRLPPPSRLRRLPQVHPDRPTCLTCNPNVIYTQFGVRVWGIYNGDDHTGDCTGEDGGGDDGGQVEDEEVIDFLYLYCPHHDQLCAAFWRLREASGAPPPPPPTVKFDWEMRLIPCSDGTTDLEVCAFPCVQIIPRRRDEVWEELPVKKLQSVDWLQLYCLCHAARYVALTYSYLDLRRYAPWPWRLTTYAWMILIEPVWKHQAFWQLVSWIPEGMLVHVVGWVGLGLLLTVVSVWRGMKQGGAPRESADALLLQAQLDMLQDARPPRRRRDRC
eukprot:TRINITY_DN24422_c0_g1_i1.p1 TRINITY_DN24422_c0_g1~~TRINITY_DN24422_c0_g1_i1.p1  ORF type:complete len:554 (+),score=173.77 TRINITY_DN24422_c0_g1_i1:74-1735(+)